MTTATATCYREFNGSLQAENGWVICPTHYGGLCCLPGSECLDEQVCHDAKNSSPGGSGYYIGLCTDATYKSSSCSSRCTDYGWGDVIYNSTTNLWACCGRYDACNNPTNDTFFAGPPQQLLAAVSSQSASSQSAPTAISTSVFSIATIPTSISSATVTVTNTPSAMVDHSSMLQKGAKAGIGVGAALAAVAIIALLVWIMLLRKRLKKHGQTRDLAGWRDGNVINKDLPTETPQDVVREHELNGYGRPHEMEGI